LPRAIRPTSAARSTACSASTTIQRSHYGYPASFFVDAFEDETFNAKFFRGYATFRKPLDASVTVDTCAYGKQQDSITYARIAGALAGFEATYHWGTFGSARIAAVGSFGDAGYRFAPFEVSSFKMASKLAVRAHYASGDDNLKSTAFHNFTAAYPAARVVSEMSLLSVSYVTNLQPYVV
jgi:hypothetical protein